MLQKLLREVDRLTSYTCSGIYTSAFRIAYGSLSVILCLQSLFYAPINFDQVPIGIIYSGHGLWFLFAALLLVGVKTKLVKLLHFATIAIVLNNLTTGVSVQELVFLTTGFWSMFMTLDTHFTIRDRQTQHDGVTPTFPIYLLAVNLALHIFSAGILKAFDPIWIDGGGIFYTYSLPWIKSPLLDFVFDYPDVLVAMNYVALVFEILTLPLLMWKRTVPLGVLLIACFFLQLTFIIRIDFIGPGGLIACIPMIGLLRINHQSKSGALTRTRLLPILGVSLLLLMSVIASIRILDSGYPMVPQHLHYISSSGENIETYPEPIHHLGTQSPLQQAIEVLNKYSVKVSPHSLFTSRHLLDTWAFRIVLKCEDGKSIEPIKVFKQNLDPGYFTIGPVTRWMQMRQYLVTRTVQRINMTGIEELPTIEVERYRRLFEFAISHIPSSIPIKSAKILLAPIPVPETYNQRNFDYRRPIWQELVNFDVSTNQLSTINANLRLNSRIVLRSSNVLQSRQIK
jgi:hypothetical protein